MRKTLVVEGGEDQPEVKGRQAPAAVVEEGAKKKKRKKNLVRMREDRVKVEGLRKEVLRKN